MLGPDSATTASGGPASGPAPRRAQGNGPGHLRRSNDPAVRPERGRRWLLAEAALALAVGGAVFGAHDVGYMLSHPFWLDESWVADSTRVPAHLIPWLSSSTPLGWTVLLRLVPGHGLQRYRLLPLVFSAAAVVAAYFVGRELRLTRVLTALLTAAAALLVPAMLVRDDLKQYSAEACLTVVLMLLVARLESDWTRPRLAWLAVVAGAGLLLTNTTVFVGVAAMAALGLVAISRRAWRRLAETAVATAVMAVVLAAIYLGIDRPRQNSSLESYWDGYYIPRNRGLAGVATFLRDRGRPVLPYLGFHSLPLVLALVVAGIVTLLWIGRPVLALVTPFTVALVMAASAARRFPFLDLRTSTFWLVGVALLMAIGVAGAVRAAQSLDARVALAVGVTALAVWVHAAAPYVRSHPIRNEDVRAQVAYVDAHRRPGDLVIVDYTAGWGFAYYERSVRPTYVHISAATVGFMATYPDVAWIVQMTGFTPHDVDAAWATATAYGARHPTTRVWILRSHMERPEARRWRIVLRGQPITPLPVGPETLLLYQPRRIVSGG